MRADSVTYARRYRSIHNALSATATDRALDAVVFITFSAGIAYYWANGLATTWHFTFWVIVMLFIATRFINPNLRLRDSIVWGTFTWLNALGIFAPIAGLTFYLLGEGGQLSFMSFVGHVIYGAVAAWIFEAREEKAGA